MRADWFLLPVKLFDNEERLEKESISDFLVF